MLSELLQIIPIVVPVAGLILWMAYRFVNKKSSKAQNTVTVNSEQMKKAAVASVVVNTMIRR